MTRGCLVELSQGIIPSDAQGIDRPIRTAGNAGSSPSFRSGGVARQAVANLPGSTDYVTDGSFKPSIHA